MPTKKTSILDKVKYELNPIAAGKSLTRKGFDIASYLLPAIMNIPLPMKHGGRVRGVGKATHGHGKAMKKQGKK